MKKKILSLLAAMALVLTACGTSQDSVEGTNDQVTIGISQFAQHPSLDNIREGILEGLKEEGFEEGKNLKVDYQNADTKIDVANQIGSNFASKDYHLVFGIATPSAMTAFTYTNEKDIPLIFSGVSDPVSAKLVNEDLTPLAKVTGVSDQLPVEAQLKMIREILPNAKTIGIMYTTSEANSISTIEIYKSLVANYGFELEIVGVASSAEIPLAADNLLSKVDAITNLTDNTVVNSLPTILAKANEKRIPVFGSEIEQVKAGSLAAEGIDYFALGKESGKMAARVLNGEDIQNINATTVKESNLYINTEVAKNLGIEIKQETLDKAVETFESIEK